MKPLLLVLLLNLTQLCTAQEEGYASVSAINNNVLVLNNCSDESGSFKVNQKIIVIQKENASQVMQVSNSSSKTGGSKEVARKYVVLTITEVERTDKLVTAIKVSRDLQHSFTINGSAAVDVRVVNTWHW
jgi:hypothetical protein